MSATSLSLPRLGRRARSASADPRWARPAFWAVLALAATLCLWHLTSSGLSNTYYAAAVKSASESWKAWFFGSLDPGSFITVDKPPLSIWVMGLSARIFGYSSFSMLVPQALATVGSVALLHATVKRIWGAPAAVAAALALALTPVTVAIARVNNPDALLVLLLVAAGYLLVRALESGRTKTLAWCGALVGLAFMTKMLQGWMVVPAFALTYLVAAKPALGTRVKQLLIAGATMVAVSAAWPLAVSLWPGSKPYIGGSTDGSVWNLIFGYNGFGRLFGGDGGPQGATFGGSPGLLRMFNAEVGGQIAWLLPLAAISLAAGLWLTRRAPRTDIRRAGWMLFGLWAVVHVAVFSSQQGVFHPYYTSALAPAVAALVGAGVVLLVRWARRSWAGVAALVVAIAATLLEATTLLGRTPDWAPWLRPVILAAAVVACAAAPLLRAGGTTARRALATVAVAGAIAIGAGPAAYSVTTASHGLNGNNVTAGPTTSGLIGGFGGAMGGVRPRGSGPVGGSAGAPTGGPGGGATADTALVRYLEANQGSAKYLVATFGSQSSASIIIASGQPVVTIGGFNGGDPAPTLSQLEQLVKSGQLKYVLVSGGGDFGGRPGGGSNNTSALTQWITAHGKAVSGVSTSGGTLYRVTA